MNEKLVEHIERGIAEESRIPAERQERLARLAVYANERLRAGRDAAYVLICTHNSRRSQLAQIWAEAAVAWFGISQVRLYSGGTEATAFDSRAVAAIERAGFQIEKTGSGPNPVYLVRYDDEAAPIECFSKVYDQPPNPKTDFCAVMTCSQADADCPIVPGASLRVTLPYEDPKAFDGTEHKATKYDERSRQIAREMLYLFSRLRRLRSANPARSLSPATSGPGPRGGNDQSHKRP